VWKLRLGHFIADLLVAVYAKIRHRLVEQGGVGSSVGLMARKALIEFHRIMNDRCLTFRLPKVGVTFQAI
jgi:hypothetical protein